MQANQIPTKFPEAFAAKAVPPYVLAIPQSTPAQPGGATLDTGFPPSTFQPESAGGNPPYGNEANGLLKQITQWLVWAAAGGFPTGYDAAFQTAISGYPKGALLMAASQNNFWLSTVDNNNTNPDTGGAGWVMFPQVTQTILGDVGVTGSAPGGTKGAAWTVQEGVAKPALGGAAYPPGANLNLTFDGTKTGAGGMDTGATPMAADLVVYKIYNPTTGQYATLGTIACSGLTYTGGNMPAGFTASSLLWAGKTDNAGNIVAFLQFGWKVLIAPVNIAGVTASAGLVPLSIATAVPAIAITASGNLNNGTVSGQPTWSRVAATASGIGQQLGGFADAGFVSNYTNSLNFVDLCCNAVHAQQIFTDTSSVSSPSVQLTISGYTFRC